MSLETLIFTSQRRFFNVFVLPLYLDWGNSIQDIRNNKKRYAHHVSENVGNFRPSKDSLVVITHIVWAAIVTSAQMDSYDLHLKRGIDGSRILLESTS